LGKAADVRLAGHGLRQIYELALSNHAFANGGSGYHPSTLTDDRSIGFDDACIEEINCPPVQEYWKNIHYSEVILN